jgi:hypothetical protein
VAWDFDTVSDAKMAQTYSNGGIYLVVSLGPVLRDWAPVFWVAVTISFATAEFTFFSIVKTVNPMNYYMIFHGYLWAGPRIVWGMLVALADGLAIGSGGGETMEDVAVTASAPPPYSVSSEYLFGLLIHASDALQVL